MNLRTNELATKILTHDKVRVLENWRFYAVRQVILVIPISLKFVHQLQ
jgi:hypothetical protein